MANGLKLEGQRFGHLTVLKKLDERENRYVVWLCRCDCGNEIKVNTRHLMRGTVKDCGCIPENSAKRGPVAEDLTGRRFGKLVAVKKMESKNGRTRWECRCDCGNMHISTALNTESMVPIQMFFSVFSRRGLFFMKAVIIFMYLWECFYRQFHF